MTIKILVIDDEPVRVTIARDITAFLVSNGRPDFTIFRHREHPERTAPPHVTFVHEALGDEDPFTTADAAIRGRSRQDIEFAQIERLLNLAERDATPRFDIGYVDLLLGTRPEGRYRYPTKIADIEGASLISTHLLDPASGLPPQAKLRCAAERPIRHAAILSGSYNIASAAENEFLPAADVVPRLTKSIVEDPNWPGSRYPDNIWRFLAEKLDIATPKYPRTPR